MDVRDAAYLSLVRCEKEGKYSNLEVDSSIKRYGFTGYDRAFYTALVYGVIEKQIFLDYVISRFSSVPPEKIEPALLPILRLGVYQILCLDRVPDSAACNECVELAKLHSHRGASGFVNGVLRAVARGKEKLPLPEKGSLSYYSVKYSCPPWLCKLWADQYGEERAEGLLQGINRNPRITLRTNTLKTDREGLLERLRAEGLACEPTSYSPVGVLLDEFTPVSSLTPLTEGLCFVQDESSQLCSLAVGARPGEFVVDTCSCPGGKSFGMAMAMENRGKILCLDLHASKLSLVEKGADRLGIGILSTAVQNGTQRREELLSKADRVLCDVPCSGLGVIAKKPDLRRKSPEELSRLPEIQYRILDTAASYVKPGGVLLYSTCTLNKEENEAVADRFLREHPAFAPDAENMPFGEARATLFPDEHGTDGFFMAKFRRG